MAAADAAAAAKQKAAGKTPLDDLDVMPTGSALSVPGHAAIIALVTISLIVLKVKSSEKGSTSQK
jgi:hypothetical protein